MIRVLSITLILVAACGGAPSPVPVAPPTSSTPPPEAAAMSSFDLNGYTLTGAEYWPYAGTADINYPADVLWGSIRRRA